MLLRIVSFLIVPLFIVPLFFGSPAFADILSLNYKKTDLGGGVLQYDFKLILTNDDNSYALGQGFNWIIFGDVPSATSTLADFALLSDTFPNPNMNFTFSGGGHNGPTFIDSVDLLTNGWIPLGVGDSVKWSGTSSFDVPDGDLLFSTLIAIDGATNTNFKQAIRVPEPAFGVLAIGLMISLTWGRRRAT